MSPVDGRIAVSRCQYHCMLQIEPGIVFVSEADGTVKLDGVFGDH